MKKWNLFQNYHTTHAGYHNHYWLFSYVIPLVSKIEKVTGFPKWKFCLTTILDQETSINPNHSNQFHWSIFSWVFALNCEGLTGLRLALIATSVFIELESI